MLSLNWNKINEILINFFGDATSITIFRIFGFKRPFVCFCYQLKFSHTETFNMMMIFSKKTSIYAFQVEVVLEPENEYNFSMKVLQFLISLRFYIDVTYKFKRGVLRWYKFIKFNIGNFVNYILSSHYRPTLVFVIFVLSNHYIINILSFGTTISRNSTH